MEHAAEKRVDEERKWWSRRGGNGEGEEGRG
jgi:hypothetical protein